VLPAALPVKYALTPIYSLLPEPFQSSMIKAVHAWIRKSPPSPSLPSVPSRGKCEYSTV
jgi:hypothetical protein